MIERERRCDQLTFATIRWKVTSSSSILSLPFPDFLSVNTTITLHSSNKYSTKETQIRRKKKAKPLGSERLVYSRTSLPAIAGPRRRVADCEWADTLHWIWDVFDFAKVEKRGRASIFFFLPGGEEYSTIQFLFVHHTATGMIRV